MAKKNNTALAVVEGFQIANRYEGIDPELLAELQDQADDLDPESGISCLQIKIPSGGGLAYEVQGEDEGDAEYMKNIDAVIVFTHRANGFWPEAFGSGDDQNKAPVCSSMDGKAGLNTETGEVTNCETCPLNQYGSATDQKGNAARGKACKNMRRLYMMMSGDPNLYLLTVPPTSIKEVNRQLAKIIAGGTPYTGLIVSLTLEKTQNANGVAYSKVVIKKSGILPPDVAAQAITLRRQIKDQYQNVALTMDDYSPAPEQGQQSKGDGVDATPMSDEEWASLTGEDSKGSAPKFEDAPEAVPSDLPFK